MPKNFIKKKIQLKNIDGYSGNILLSSVDKNQLDLIFHNLKKISGKNWFRQVTKNFETLDKKYYTLFRSPFVYKKSKATYLFYKYTISLNFYVLNSTDLKRLISHVSTYNGIVSINFVLNS